MRAMSASSRSERLDREQVFEALCAMRGKRVELVTSGETAVVGLGIKGTLEAPDSPGSLGEDDPYYTVLGDNAHVVLAGWIVESGYRLGHGEDWLVISNQLGRYEFASTIDIREVPDEEEAGDERDLRF
jgi:hypothetical protein